MIDLEEKYEELKKLISQYLSGQIQHDAICNFAWEIINYFEDKDKSKEITIQKFEPEFWFAIWQIQHVSDEEHWNEGITHRYLQQALDYLKKDKILPKESIGSRP